MKNAQSEQYPYNLILSSYANESADAEAFPVPLYFIIPQKNARSNTAMVTSLLKAGTVVLSANDESELPADLQKEQYTGLKTFLASAPDNAVIILISEEENLDAHEMQVIPGGNGLIASGTVLKSLIRAGQLSDFSVTVQSLLLTFYRMKWVDGSKTAAFCLENGFQAAGLVISDKTASPQLEKFVCALYDLLSKENISEGMQYSIINTGTQVFSISENLYTVILFVVIGISLLANCLFSFMFGKQKLENRIIFLKWWYTGPLLVFLTFGLTILAQYVVVTLFTNYGLHPLFALILKVSFIVVSFLLLCELRYIIPLAETDYLYAFFMTLAAALDVFIFTSIDMPLLLPFFIFYIIVLGARAFKKWWINLIIFVLLAFPLIYVLIRAMPYLRSDIFASFTASPLILDFFTGAMLLPYLLMIIRIFTGLGIWDKNKGTKRIIIETAVLSGLLIIVIILSATCFKKDVVQPAASETETALQKTEIVLSDDNVSIQAQPLFDNGMLKFDLKLSSEKQVIRYDMEVSSAAVVPLYSANLPFSFAESEGSAVFNLDENPVDPFSVSGTAPAELPFTLYITAWLKDGSQILVENHSVTFDTGSRKSTRPEIVIE